MKCQILHESRGRMRVYLFQNGMSLAQADMLETALCEKEGIVRVQVYDRTCDAIIYYKGNRENVIDALRHFRYEGLEVKPTVTGRELNRQYQNKLVRMVVTRGLRKCFVPMPIRHILACIRAWHFIKEGIACLLKGKIEVALLDATAITVSLLRQDMKTASSIMFLLRIGETLEEWTHKKSVDDLARIMSLNIDQVWVEENGQECLMPIDQVKVGDIVVIRTGHVIPLDGEVISCDAAVNQASMTGEPISIHKSEGAYVYAGTVVEQGQCRVRVKKEMGEGQYDRIIKMIEDSEKLKSAAEDRASHLADQLVPYSLGGTLLTYLITRDPTRALAFLMVDFSCALKLAMPISVLSAMKECADHDMTVKGGRFMEMVAEADTIVFDKTGTLTYANPKVRQVIPFNGNSEQESLRLAACLEEHYPHSIANAVVEEAKRRGLDHEEKHSKVEYVIAHGIASSIDGKKAIIGSYHFVFEDEKCVVPEQEKDKFDHLPQDCSLLYMAIGGVLAAVICIDDPVRPEAADVIKTLHEIGFSKIVMMTGDNEAAARSIARQVGVDEYHAGVLPEDKALFVQKEKEQGKTVMMIGDGINDSPALSEADVGIAISTGAAIAREISDIMITTEDLVALVQLKRLSDALMKRIDENYRFIIGFNSLLILSGVAGILQPTTSALLHNISTIAIGLRSTTNLIKEA